MEQNNKPKLIVIQEKKTNLNSGIKQFQVIKSFWNTVQNRKKKRDEVTQQTESSASKIGLFSVF